MKPLFAFACHTAAIATVFGALWLPAACYASPSKLVSRAESSNKLRLIAKKAVRNGRDFEETIKYPQIAGRSPRIAAANQAIRQYIRSQLRAARKQLSREPYSAEPIDRGFLSSDFTVELATAQYLSIKFDFQGYTGGAAHPMEWSSGFNYSLNEGKVVTLEDMFKNKAQIAPTLSVLSLDQLTVSDVPDLSWLESGAGPDVSNFKKFVANGSGLKIYFDDYQIAPYADGVFEISIPWSRIKPLSSRFVNQIAKRNSPHKSEQLKESTLEKQLAVIAIGAYSRVIEKDPENSTAYAKRAEWYEKLGRHEIAKQDLARAASRDGDQVISSRHKLRVIGRID